MSETATITIGTREFEVPVLFKAWVAHNTLKSNGNVKIWRILENILIRLELVENQWKWFYIGFFQAGNMKEDNFETYLRLLDFMIEGMLAKQAIGEF